MKKINYIKASVFCIAVAILTLSYYPRQLAASGLLLSPTRLVFEGRERKGSLIVNNPSDETENYRVQVINRRMLENGTYENAEVPQDDELFADKIIRISPRSFTLKPKQTQTVRISVRKPKNLKPGEYRSHLRVQVVPKADPPSLPGSSGDVGISVKVNYGMTIPLIVRHGELDYDVVINDIDLRKDDKSGRYILKTRFSRTGTRSTYGALSVTYVGDDGEDQVLKFLSGLSVFYPNSSRIFSIPLDVPEGLALDNGTIIVTYRELEKEGGKVIATKAKNL